MQVKKSSLIFLNNISKIKIKLPSYYVTISIFIKRAQRILYKPSGSFDFRKKRILVFSLQIETKLNKAVNEMLKQRAEDPFGSLVNLLGNVIVLCIEYKSQIIRNARKRSLYLKLELLKFSTMNFVQLFVSTALSNTKCQKLQAFHKHTLQLMKPIHKFSSNQLYFMF